MFAPLPLAADHRAIGTTEFLNIILNIVEFIDLRCAQFHECAIAPGIGAFTHRKLPCSVAIPLRHGRFAIVHGEPQIDVSAPSHREMIKRASPFLMPSRYWARWDRVAVP